MAKQVSELIEEGCFTCTANLIPASAFLAIAEHRLVVDGGDDDDAPVWRRPVVVCHECLVAASLGEKRDE